MAKRTLRETLTKIRNAVRAGKTGVEIKKNRINLGLAKIFLREGLIDGISESSYSSLHKPSIPHIFIHFKSYSSSQLPGIAYLKLINRRGLQIYIGCKEISEISNDFDLVIVSTSGGLITGLAASQNNLGGALICAIPLFLLFNYESSFLGKKKM